VGGLDGVRMNAAARIAQRGDVIDIHPQA
jgi:hypothetical protein